MTNSQLDTTNKSQQARPFQAGDHKAHINRRAQRHSKHKREQKHKRSTKEVPPWNGQLDTTNESEEISPFSTGDHKAQINRSAQRHNKHKTEKNKWSTKEVPPWKGQ